MSTEETTAQKTERYIERGIEGLDLIPEEREKFVEEVEEEIPDWARDENGNIVLTLYYSEAVEIVRERWLEEREK